MVLREGDFACVRRARPERGEDRLVFRLQLVSKSLYHRRIGGRHVDMLSLVCSELKEATSGEATVVNERVGVCLLSRRGVRVLRSLPNVVCDPTNQQLIQLALYCLDETVHPDVIRTCPGVVRIAGASDGQGGTWRGIRGARQVRPLIHRVYGWQTSFGRLFICSVQTRNAVHKGGVPGQGGG